MKLRNKKTDVVVDVEIRDVFYDNIAKFKLINKATGSIIAMYNSLAELNAEWKDYEGPKGIQGVMTQDEDIIIRMGSIEEAEKAVEKLKAWTRLRGKGFKFTGWNWYRRECGFTADEDKFFKANGEVMTREAYEDLDLLFEGEE